MLAGLVAGWLAARQAASAPASLNDCHEAVGAALAVVACTRWRVSPASVPRRPPVVRFGVG